ncbi:MAG: SDR family oxidoreductase [Ancalomicrobiaceae bacterium]|nr:SDR family oxidoreductase [Ancalomicrobiaceae bacterium]
MGAQFKDQVIIVTGAGDGIGRAAAEGFAAEGGVVVVVDVKGVETTVAGIEATGGRAIAAPLDVRDAPGWSRLVDDLVAKFGTIDVLVNNAGVAVPGDTAADVTEEIWDRIMDINAKGVWLGMRAVLPTMRKAGKGKICNVASTAAHIGLRDAAAYCASKGAVLALTRQAGVQYAPENIQINSVSPGTTMTGLQRDVTEAQRATFLTLTPINRFAQSIEVARTILFLCSEGSSFVTASDLSVDGGMVAL